MTEALKENSLDFDDQVFSDLMQQASDIAKTQYASMGERPAYQMFEPSEVASWFAEDLPESGMSFSTLLQEADEKVLQTATNNMGPHMYGYVMAGGTQVYHCRDVGISSQSKYGQVASRCGNERD